MNPVNHRRLTLIEVLQPQSFKTTPERSRVTRTIVQPEIDAFEQMEAQSVSAAEKSALEGRQAETLNQARLAASTVPQLAPQLIGA
jgi:hypothetical protein